MRYNGSSWNLTDSNGSAVAMSGNGSLASPFNAAGFTLRLSGSAVAGDSFMIRPTALAAGQKVTVYPISAGEYNEMPPEANSVLKLGQKLFVTGQVKISATTAA